MLRPKHLLLPLVREANSVPCPHCGRWHQVKISENPTDYLVCDSDSCNEWVSDLHTRAKKILEDFINPIRLR